MAPSTSPALQFHLAAFDGPLDLLLHLIRENRIDIYDIPIAEITQQYLEYLEMWEALDLSVAGEYLVMAATLVEIKSRLLLPKPPPPEADEMEDPRAELVQRLLEYQKYQSTVETFRLWEDHRAQIFFRGALEDPDDYTLPVEAGEMNAAQLLGALKRMLAQAGVGEEPVTAVVPRRRVSLRMKMAEVIRKVRAAREGIAFELLFEVPWQRYDVVLTFLALLELLRHGRIRADQKRPDDDIMLYPVESPAA